MSWETLFAFLTIVALLTSVSIYMSIGGMVERRSKFQETQAKITACEARLREVEAEYTAVGTERKAMGERKVAAEAELARLKKEAESAADRRPELVHELPDLSSPVGHVYSLTVAHRGEPIGLDKQPMNPIWRYAQVIEIRTQGPEKAKELVRSRFPENGGFRIVTCTLVERSQSTREMVGS